MSERSLACTNKIFVKAVERYPCLYDPMNPNYATKEFSDIIWQTIGNEVNDTVEGCKARWKNLRTVFVRRQNPSKSGSNARNMRPYYLDQAMQFLKPFLKQNNLKSKNGFASKISSMETLEQESANHVEQTEYDVLDQFGVTLKQEDNDIPNVLMNVGIGLEEDRELRDSDQLKKRKLGTDNDHNEIKRISDHNNIMNRDNDHNVMKRDCDYNNFMNRDSDHNEVMAQLRQRNVYNPDEDFFRSLLPDVILMTPSQKRKFKIEVLKLIGECLDDSAEAIS